MSLENGKPTAQMVFSSRHLYCGPANELYFQQGGKFLCTIMSNTDCWKHLLSLFTEALRGLIIARNN